MHPSHREVKEGESRNVDILSPLPLLIRFVSFLCRSTHRHTRDKVKPAHPTQHQMALWLSTLTRDHACMGSCVRACVCVRLCLCLLFGWTMTLLQGCAQITQRRAEVNPLSLSVMVLVDFHR